MDEQDLIDGLGKGDEAAFRQAIGSYQPAMLSLARSIVGNRFADEVAQEAWVSVLGAIKKFEGRSSLKTWILRIVANEARSRLRREKRMVSLDSLVEDGSILESRFSSDGHWKEPPFEWEHDSPEAILSSTEMRACIELLMTALPPMQAATLVMREQQDMALADICNILEVSESNVRVLLHRARQRVFACVEHFQNTGECNA